MFIVSQTSVRYLRPARLDDLLRVTVEVRHAGQASMTIAQVAWRGEERLAYVVANDSQARGTVFIFPTLILNFRRELFNATA